MSIANVTDARRFRNTTIQDVREECRRIENELGSRGLLRNMHRLDPFLTGLEHYRKAVDVLCQGTPYLPWIWAPVVLILKVCHLSRCLFHYSGDDVGCSQQVNIVPLMSSLTWLILPMFQTSLSFSHFLFPLHFFLSSFDTSVSICLLLDSSFLFSSSFP